MFPSLPYFIIHPRILLFCFGLAAPALCLAPKAADVSPHTHLAVLQTIVVDFASDKVLKIQCRTAAGSVHAMMAMNHAPVPRYAAIHIIC